MGYIVIIATPRMSTERYLHRCYVNFYSAGEPECQRKQNARIPAKNTLDNL